MAKVTVNGRGADAPDASQPTDLRSIVRTIAHRLAGDADVLPVEGHLPSFDGGTGWLNSDPLTPAGLRRQVVLVDFWTYTCVNWLRTLPYVRACEAKYRDFGLTVIGVHTPEFEFEREPRDQPRPPHPLTGIVNRLGARPVPYLDPYGSCLMRLMCLSVALGVRG
jgi:hypothetical protein